MRTLKEFRAALQDERANKELRKTPSRLGVALFDSIHQVDAAAWESVTGPDRLYLRPHYLAALEAADPPGMRFRYLMLFDGARPVAVGAVQMIELTGEAVGSRVPAAKKTLPGDAKRKDKAKAAIKAAADHVKRHVHDVAHKVGDKVTVKIALCGNSFLSGEHGFAHVPDADPAELFHGLAEALYRLRRAEKHHGAVGAVLVKDFFGAASEALPSDALRRFDYRGFEVDPAMVVPINPAWRSFDDYLAAMTSKYRSRARSARKKGKALRREVLSLEAIEANTGRLHTLVEAVAAKAQFRLSAHAPAYFAELKRHLGDAFTLTAYRLDDWIVGFTTTLRFGDELEGHYLGLDYEHNVTHGVYQNILYDDIQAGIEAGARQVWLGRTALEIKSGMGAVPRPARCYMRHVGPLRNRILKPIFRLLKPTTWTPRNPFPEPKES